MRWGISPHLRLTYRQRREIESDASALLIDRQDHNSWDESQKLQRKFRSRVFWLGEPGEPEHRILIVEDDGENRLLLERLLQNAGFQVRVAGDGEQGVELSRTWRPHFVWMDLRMPGMGGVEAARQIRALEGGRDVKIVAVSASVFASERSGVLAAGLDDFVGKPYRPGEIFDCMARHLGVRYRVNGTAPVSPGKTAQHILCRVD